MTYVLHHARARCSTEARRLQALREMYRVVKGGGAILVGMPNPVTIFITSGLPLKGSLWSSQITVWAFEQPPSSKRQFQKQDNMVPWHLQRRFSGRSSTAAGTLDADRRECGSEVYQRFCHVFARDELPRLARTIEGLEVKCEMYDQGNWQIHLTKGRGQEALERAPTDTEAASSISSTTGSSEAYAPSEGVLPAAADSPYHESRDVSLTVDAA
eukprot:scaffold685_cov281-Pinguiococcus_pyrenoidosus.AAC.16